MAIKNAEIEVKWNDIKRWTSVLEITHGLMLKKFHPHFVQKEEDLMQEMMVVLIKAVRRIKKGEISSEQNYVITCLKYAAFKMAKDLISYDKTTVFLEDLKTTEDRGKAIEWLDLLDLSSISCETVLRAFEIEEERLMILVILGVEGHTRRKLREKLKVEWAYMTRLENRVKEKLVEIIKMYTT